MAHTLASSPSLAARILGAAGVVAGVVILLAYVIELPAELFPPRLVVFGLGVIAIGMGVHRRQSSRAAGLSLAVMLALLFACAFFVATVVLVRPGSLIGFWSGVALWMASAVFGLASAWIGGVSRIGSIAVAVGALLTLTGIDRLGLVSAASPTIFNVLSQVGIVVMSIGWIVLGIDVALRRSTVRAPT